MTESSSIVLIIALIVLKCFLEKFKVSFSYLPCHINRVKSEKCSVEMGVHFAQGSDQNCSVWKSILWQLVQRLAFGLIWNAKLQVLNLHKE